MIFKRSGAGSPAVMHVTHYKAGSQWILEILRKCVPDLVVTPKPRVAHFIDQPLEEGKVYPTVYVTREQFEAADLPSRWRRFVVIRDLRDALVSGYFSVTLSHSTEGFPAVAKLRTGLEGLSKEEAMLRMMRGGLRLSGAMQRSWLEAGEELIKYEDLLERDVELLEPVLIDRCELPVSRERLRRAVEEARFERLSGGRRPGEEDPGSHWRKGIAGDWRNHFDERLTETFKELFGDLLIATGYETDDDW